MARGFDTHSQHGVNSPKLGNREPCLPVRVPWQMVLVTIIVLGLPATRNVAVCVGSNTPLRTSPSIFTCGSPPREVRYCRDPHKS